MFERYKRKISDKVDHWKDVKAWKHSEKTDPLYSLECRTELAKDFIRVVNGLFRESQIILTHYGIGYQYNVFHKKYGLIGYVIRKKYFLNADLIYKKLQKLDDTTYMYEFLPKEAFFKELLKGKMIKPYGRHYYKLGNYISEEYYLCIQGSIIDTKMAIIVDDDKRINDRPSIRPLG